ncbi:SOS response-associated peptidase [Ekhidna sp.]|uniref:SOS response-associated peptidase n=1 Tax=Ekhidna sp. TaxID=2608089 RepID=UPI003BAA6056
MLDRYTITLQPDELALVLGAEVPDTYQPQFNAAPTKVLPTIVSSDADKISFLNWGLMAMWSNNKAMSPKFFNLPLDSVLNKSSYRKKLLTNRCVIPMDGFYLWKQVAKKQQVPHYFFYPDKKIFSVAGLWEEGDDGSHSFIMITRPANKQIADFQDDMPAILDAASTRSWLQSENEEELQELLNKESLEEFISHTVSPKIKDIDGNDALFIKPAPASDQHGNYTLFT